MNNKPFWMYLQLILLGQERIPHSLLTPIILFSCVTTLYILPSQKKEMNSR